MSEREMRLGRIREYDGSDLAQEYDFVLGEALIVRISELARKRSQSPAETLNAALDALAPTDGVVTFMGRKPSFVKQAIELAEGQDLEEMLKHSYRLGRAAAAPLVDALRAIVALLPEDTFDDTEFDSSWTEGEWKPRHREAKAALAAWEGE